MQRTRFLLSILLMLCAVAQGQDKVTRLDGSKISTVEIEQTVQRLMQTGNVQGLNLAVLNNNKTAFIRSYGYSNKPKNHLLDTSTIVYAASFSKAVFGYLMMKLVEEKILELDRPLYLYLGTALFVTIIEMIRTRIIEVHCFFDQP